MGQKASGRLPRHDLDPRRSVFRWAWRQAGNHRSRFGITAAVIFTMLALVGNSYTPRAWGSPFQIGSMAVGMAAVGLLLMSMLYAVIVAPYQQRNALRERLRDAQAQGLAGVPTLRVETGNGPPWDDPRYGPKPKYVNVLSELGKAAALSGTRLAPGSPPPPPPPPAPEHAKRFRVTNTGEVAAIRCRAKLTGGLTHNVPLAWDLPGSRTEEITLAAGESEFCVLPAKHFPVDGEFDVELSVFGENLPSPIVDTFQLLVRKARYPQLIQPPTP